MAEGLEGTFLENIDNTESTCFKMSIGKVPEYDSKDKWPTYKLRLNSWLVANEVTDADKKKNILLAVIGNETLDLLISLSVPNRVEDSTFDALVNLLDDHFRAGVNAVSESLRFDMRNQLPNESVSDYVVAISKLSINAGFGTGNALYHRLRNKLICGLHENNSGIREALLREGDALTWENAKAIAMSMDVAQKHPCSNNSPPAASSSSTGVNKVRQYKKSHDSKQKHLKCTRCAGPHKANNCPNRHLSCKKCGKKGHFAKCCRTKTNDGRSGQVSVMESCEEINHMAEGVRSPITIPMKVEGKPIKLQLDTGCGLSLISSHVYQSKFSHCKLSPRPDLSLNSYTGHPVRVLGEINVDVSYRSVSCKLPLVVVEGRGTSLFGRNWLSHIKLAWNEIFTVGQVKSHSLDEVLSKHAQVFRSDCLGEISGFEASIELKPDCTPIFCKARTVPWMFRDKVDADLEKRISDGSLVPVQQSKWASPLVCVPKDQGKNVRICADYSVSVNKAIEDNVYPLPLPEDLFTSMKGEKFSKIDLASAYTQLKLDKKSQEILTMNTPKGLLMPTRLPFGVKVASMQFQKVLDQVLSGIPNTCCYIDDILVTGSNDHDHLKTLDEVFARLEKHGIKVNKQKSSFMQSSVSYLGHVLSKSGIAPNKERVRAIMEAKTPKKVEDVQQFMGMVNYYNRFIKQIATKAEPLYNLTRDGIKFVWSKECQTAFDTLKEELSRQTLLTRFDPKKQLVMACDASPYGVGAILSHREDDNSETPIAYASRTLSDAESNYAQTHREALSIMFGLKKFSKYLIGNKFTLITDHSSLSTVFNPNTKLESGVALSRLHRWKLILSEYDYKVEYRKGSQLCHVDYLSRAPLSSKESFEMDVNYFSVVDSLPVTADEIARETSKCSVLSKVRDFVKFGWPKHVSEVDLEPYFSKRSELSVDKGCILYGCRVVLPYCLIDRVISELHEDHSGVVRMKSVARSYFWFPNIDSTIETIAKECRECQMVGKSPPKTWYPFQFENKPWFRLHADFAEYEGQNYLIVVDSYSKWLHVESMSSITSSKAILSLRQLFSTHGLCAILYTDNATSFTSAEFEGFLKSNGIVHKYSPPYHAASNGQAERCVQTAKNFLKKLRGGFKDRNLALSRFLLGYNTTNHATTGRAPCELLMGRQLRTLFTLMKPSLQADVDKAQDRSYVEGSISKSREFQSGDSVKVRNMIGRDKWLFGHVVKRIGPLRYLVRIGSRVRYCHLDHLLSAGTHTDDNDYNPNHPHYPNAVRQGLSDDTANQANGNHQTTSLQRSSEVDGSTQDVPITSPTATPSSDTQSRRSLSNTPPPATPTIPRRSNRVRKPPERYVPA